MRRADRLFQLLLMLRGRRRTTARQLAEWLSVSDRTVYRDISDLSASGVPIQGEAGVGYRLASGFEVPPLMFTRDELEALVLGVRVVRAWGGPKLGRASEQAMAKIEAVLPGPRRGEVRRSRLFAPEFLAPPELGPRLDAQGPPAGTVLLGRQLAPRWLVRAAPRLPQLPPRPDDRPRPDGRRVRSDRRDLAHRVLPRGGSRRALSLRREWGAQIKPSRTARLTASAAEWTCSLR